MGSSRLERWIGRKFRLRHLELIAEIYDCRSILKASRRLSLTQPTVTKALQDVEATLGLKLFERTNRGIEPTDSEARSLRVMSDLWHWPTQTRWPSMVARVALANGIELYVNLELGTISLNMREAGFPVEPKSQNAAGRAHIYAMAFQVCSITLGVSDNNLSRRRGLLEFMRVGIVA